jgi:hypothetical protein
MSTAGPPHEVAGRADEHAEAGAGPVPKAPIREDSISKFDPNVGDSSRALLWVVLALAGLLLAGILLFTTYRP